MKTHLCRTQSVVNYAFGRFAKIGNTRRKHLIGPLVLSSWMKRTQIGVQGDEAGKQDRVS